MNKNTVDIATPIAEKRPSTSTIHNHERIDNYAWLREKESPDVIDYLNAENDFAKAHTSHTEAFKASLYQEMLDHLDSMAAKYPDLITARAEIGNFKTYEDNPIYWLRMSMFCLISRNRAAMAMCSSVVRWTVWAPTGP